MHYVKTIFNKEEDNGHAHTKLVRYSKGDFIGPLIKIKFIKDKIKIYSSFHFVDELLELIAMVLKNEKIRFIGTLLWNEDLGLKLAKLGIKYSKVTKSRGIFKYSLDNDVNLVEFVEAFNNYNILPNFSNEKVSISTKKSFPKPNKEFSDKFCRVTLPISMKTKIFEEFLFDLKMEKNIKEVEIKTEIKITDIILPKNVKDFALARRLAKREGIFKRSLKINKGEEVKSEIKFII